jgi:hypothetical protein
MKLDFIFKNELNLRSQCKYRIPIGIKIEVINDTNFF